MKKLWHYVNEALYELAFAVGEIVSFIPTKEQAEAFGIPYGTTLFGEISSIHTTATENTYDIKTTVNGTFLETPLTNINQDIPQILTRNK